MRKCFWCGTWNHDTEAECHSCGRSMRWSSVLSSLLRPSIGGILGAQVETAIRNVPPTEAEQVFSDPQIVTR